MVPVPTTYLNVPIFGSGASNIVPQPSTYAGGFLAGQLFPAEYENWLMNRLTNNASVSQTTDLSVAAEIVNILSHASIMPDPASTTQLYAALNALYATVGALSSEASTRSSADTTLQSNINAEATARANADTTLQNNINLKAPLASPALTGSPTVNGSAIAPRPTSSSGVGQFVIINASNSYALPAGGTWVWSAITENSLSGDFQASQSGGPTAGGTTILTGSGSSFTGWAWRVS